MNRAGLSVDFISTNVAFFFRDINGFLIWTFGEFLINISASYEIFDTSVSVASEPALDCHQQTFVLVYLRRLKVIEDRQFEIIFD